MASPDVLEFATLLEPIPGDNPTGEDLRADSSPSSLYYQIKDARSAARAAERQAQAPKEGEDPARADWRPVLRHSQKALTERTKDLEVVAFVTEALVRLKGYAGLRDGFRLARELIERFWDGLYPMPDEDGLQTRLAPLTSLNGEDAEGTLIAPIGQVPITQGSEGHYASYHYQLALALSQVADEDARQKRIEAGAVSLAQLEKSVAETPAQFFIDLVDDLTKCEEEYNALDQVLQEKCGPQAPPTSNIRAALASCRDVVMALARHKLPSSGEALPAEDGQPATGETSGGGPGVGPLRTRDDALNLLLKVADFFHRTEPHTPVSFALEQAVRWGRMSLPDLLTDLIEDPGARQALFHRVGIKAPQTDGS